MKKIFVILTLTLLAVAAVRAQGLVYFSSSTQNISTNAVVGGAAAGKIIGAGNYRFALFYSKTATSVNGQSAAIAGNASENSYAFNDPAWTFVTNGASIALPGRFISLSVNSDGSTTVPGVAGGSAAHFVVIGWSANIGTNVTQVEAWLSGGATIPGWIGQSVVSGAITTGDGNSITAPLLFSGSAPGMQSFTLGLAAANGASTAPYIIAGGQPTSKTAYTGTTTSFNVLYGANPAPTFQWQHNGTNIVSGTNAILPLSSLATTDAGYYSVTISNIVGSVTSSNALLTLVSPPGYVVFASSVEDISTNSVAGGAAAGKIVSAGSYRFALFYSKTATEVNGQTATVAGNSSENSYAFNDPAWTFVAYGDNTATAGRFASDSADASGNTVVPGAAGATAQFVVVGWSANIGQNISDVQAWLSGGALTPGWIGQSVVSGSITIGDGNLISPPGLFGSTSPEMQGFTLGLASPDGAPVAPYILTGGQPATQTAYIGSTAAFSVSYGANPVPTFQWQVNGTNILSGTNAVLTLSSVATTDAGYYSVTISNIAGSVTSSNALLTVVPPPGYVIFANAPLSSSKVFTNTAVGGAITGLTATNGVLYYYALYASATATNMNGLTTAIQGSTNVGYVFNDPAWTLVAYGTNIARGGCFVSANANASGLTPVSVVTGGGYARFVVMGWSMNIGTNVAAVQTWFNGGNPTGDGWIGQSGISGAIQLGDNGILVSPVLFGAGDYQLKGFTLGLASPNPAQFYSRAYVPPPILTTIKMDNSVKLSWPAVYSSYEVQSASSFMGPWNDVAGTPTTEGTNLTQTVPVTGQQQPYFRLIVQ